MFCLSHNWSWMVVFEVEVGSARIHPSHLFEESSCYSNFLPRFDSSIYLGKIGNRSFLFLWRETANVKKWCFWERSFGGAVELVESSVVATLCFQKCCSTGACCLCIAMGVMVWCAPVLALPVMGCLKDTFLASPALPYSVLTLSFFTAPLSHYRTCRFKL